MGDTKRLWHDTNEKRREKRRIKHRDMLWEEYKVLFVIGCFVFVELLGLGIVWVVVCNCARNAIFERNLK